MITTKLQTKVVVESVHPSACISVRLHQQSAWLEVAFHWLECGVSCGFIASLCIKQCKLYTSHVRDVDRRSDVHQNWWPRTGSFSTSDSTTSDLLHGTGTRFRWKLVIGGLPARLDESQNEPSWGGRAETNPDLCVYNQDSCRTSIIEDSLS